MTQETLGSKVQGVLLGTKGKRVLLVQKEKQAHKDLMAIGGIQVRMAQKESKERKGHKGRKVRSVWCCFY